MARYDGPGSGQDEASAIANAGTAGVVVSGWSQGADGDLDYATIAYSASDGAKLWRSRVDGSAHSDDYATAIAASPDGTRAYVTGETTSTPDNSNYTTVVYETGFVPPS